VSVALSRKTNAKNARLAVALNTVYIYRGVFPFRDRRMDPLIRVLNDEDRQALAWLRKHVGEARVTTAARELATSGKRPFVSAVCRFLGVWPPVPCRSPSGRATAVGDKHLAHMRQLLAQRSATKLHA
jgi:hypothetical protein